MSYSSKKFKNGDVLLADDLNNLDDGILECQSANNIYSQFKGKIISLIGDSASTYEGYTPVADGWNLKHRNRYPNAAPDWVGTVNDTWWMRTINLLGAKLGVNSSWAGSCVVNTSASNSGDVGPDACISSTTRIQGLGFNGKPDIIWVLAGGNDMGRGTTLGTFDGTKAHTVDLNNNVISNFAEAYKQLIMRLQYYYPEAKIIAFLQHPCKTYVSWQNIEKYGNVIKQICSYFGIEVVDFRKCGFNHNNIAKYDLNDGIHPNAAGFRLMSDYLYSKMPSLLKMDSGETIVYSVTNQLSSCVNKQKYIRGIRKNDSYIATILSEDESTGGNVRVYMGSEDITDTNYDISTGTLTINNVTGDIIISESSETIEITGLNADGETNLIYTLLDMPKLSVKYTPSNTTQRNIIWESSNIGVLDVDNGVLTLLNEGNATVTAKSVVNTALSVTWDITVVSAGNRTTNNSHANELPETATSVTNLASILTHVEDNYYTANGWSTTNGTNSITFPVLPGDRISSTAFDSKSINESTIDGTRVTFLQDDTIIESRTPANVYTEYKSNGYIVVPANCNCISIPYTNTHKTNLEVRILTLANPT